MAQQQVELQVSFDIEDREEEAYRNTGLATPDLAAAQATVSAASNRAGAYISSWASWAGEKRKTGWGRSASAANVVPTSKAPNPSRPHTKRRSRASHTSNSGSELSLGKSSYEEEMFEVKDLDRERARVTSEIRSTEKEPAKESTSDAPPSQPSVKTPPESESSIENSLKEQKKTEV